MIGTIELRTSNVGTVLRIPVELVDEGRSYGRDRCLVRVPGTRSEAWVDSSRFNPNDDLLNDLIQDVETQSCKEQQSREAEAAPTTSHQSAEASPQP